MKLSPKGILVPDESLNAHFEVDWRKGWFYLGAEKINAGLDFSTQFWQGISKEYITELCHLPENSSEFSINEPGLDVLSSWLMQAPPMRGGEYLSIDMLKAMWKGLDAWVANKVQQLDGLHVFLNTYAPKWNKVGRVCFHLAENKKDPGKPFAFLATYSTGFGAGGKLKHLPLKKALEEYSESDNHRGLVKLLTPVQRAADRCPWVKALVESAEVYQPLAWSVNQAYKLLTTTKELEESGLSVRIPNWWKKRARPQVSVKVDTKNQTAIGLNAMLDFSVEVAIGDEPLSQEELDQIVKASSGMLFLKGQWVELDCDKLSATLDHWKQVKQQAGNDGVSFIEGMRLLAGAPSDLGKDLEEERGWLTVSAGQVLEKTLQSIKDPSRLSAHKEVASCLKATLRPYQKDGLNWLHLLSTLGLGACLADDMGLGKTLQILALLLTQTQKPSLLVVPASLLGNWKREASCFTPSLRLFFAHTSQTKSDTLLELAKDPLAYLEDVNLVVTTYAMVQRQEWLTQMKWNLVILDEAQAIKNPGTKQARAIKNLQARSRIALTGTPIENRLTDLWSLFDFINPGLLGSFKRFKEYCQALEDRPYRFEPLRKLISPYILRRMKTDPKIVPDLPAKIETLAFCQLTKQQVYHYQSTVNDLQQRLDTLEPEKRRGIVLQTIMRLKQICNHPSQFLSNEDYKPNESGKFIRLKQICEELAERQEKVLVFTQFSEMMEPLADYLASIFGMPGLKLHGKTPIKERMELVKTFQSDSGPPFFVLSLKAGGTGLNLTAASHVIHFDRWWNPAVENQATDRAFRIGQQNKVQVHKFVTQGTIENKIDKMIQDKQNLSSDVLGMPEEEVKITELSNEELMGLVSLDIEQAVVT